MLAHGSSEAFLRIAVGTGNAEALDLAERFAQGHPSDRMRLHAWGAGECRRGSRCRLGPGGAGRSQLVAQVAKGFRKVLEEG
jgi:hypothetical protein